MKASISRLLHVLLQKIAYLTDITEKKILEFLDGDSICVLGTDCGGKYGTIEELLRRP